MDDHATGDQLMPGGLTPVPGGRWSGLLFDNPKLGLVPRLSWSFSFPFAEVEREYGSSPVSLDIDWVPLAPATWRDLAGQALSSSEFAEPAEASVYFFQHHRFDAVELQVLEQREMDIRVATMVSGDIDGLGIDPIAAIGWLSFAGIHVSLSSARSAAEASARLRDFIDVTGLLCTPGIVAGQFLFRPGG